MAKQSDRLKLDLGTGSMALGVPSVMLCWWFPFGFILGVVGAGLGSAGWLSGDHTGRAALGFVLSTAGAGAGFLARAPWTWIYS